MSFEEQVRVRAYHIWLAGGMADGRAEEHWICAEQALRGETSASAEVVVILTKTAAKPRKAAAAKPAAKAANTKATKAAVAKIAARPAAKARSAKSAMVQPTAH